MSVELLVGCYTPPMGEGRGIRQLSLAEDGTVTDRGLVAVTESPSFLIVHDSVVYVVNEADQGRVTSFRWRPDGSSDEPGAGRLDQLSVQNTGGAHPCHLAVDPTGSVLAAANYTSGSVSLHRIADGVIAPASAQLTLTGHGPVADRQDGPHAHQVVFAEGLLFVVDLGSDLVWRYELDADLGTRELAPLVLPAGFGPRQLLLEGDYAYVLGELSNDLAVFALSEPAAPRSVQPAYRAGLPDGNLAAALVGSAPGRFLVSHRGADRLVEFGYGAGSVELLREFPAGGRSPRHLAVVAGLTLVAAQLSDEVVAVAADGTARPIPVPSAVCVLPL